MNKEAIIQKVAKNNVATQPEVRRAFEALMDITREALGRGERVLLRGIGTFKVSIVASRIIRNPRSGIRSFHGPKRRVRFTADPEIKKL